MNIKDDLILSRICKGYLVGGSVRDFLLGKPFVDRDIVIKGAKNFALEIKEKFDGTFVPLDEENGIYRVVMPDKVNFLDISELQGDNIAEDIERRDFTINAIAYDLGSERFIDTTGGEEDLKNGVLRYIKEENFVDDPLRVLRAFRFMAVTGFKADENLIKALEKYKNLIMKPSKERIAYEIMKLFGGNYTAKTLLFMDKFGVLELIFPPISDMKRVPPNTHHHLDLFHHSVETVRNIEEIYANSQQEVREHLQRVDFGGFPRINHLKLAGFLHDIGKFSVWTIEPSGRHRFIKHDDVGAKMCVPLLKGLKFSKKQIDYISLMIKKHIYPSSLLESPDLNPKVMMRFVRKSGENSIDNIVLAKADRLSARGVDITEEDVRRNIEGLDRLLNFYLENKDSLKPLEKLLDGHEVMEVLGINQSPKLGKILSELKEAQINGDVVTKDDALNFIKKFVV